jgi:C-terminal processing protease CtpA/Prc
MAVAPQRAAEKAGLKVGDRILALDGESPKVRPVGEWRAGLREQAAGTHVRLRVADGTAERKVDLVLADAIPPPTRSPRRTEAGHTRRHSGASGTVGRSRLAFSAARRRVAVALARLIGSRFPIG